MYQSFFSFNTKPFDLLPNPYFLYLSKSHKKAMTYLDYSVRNKSGFVLISGEIGSGKTTLIRDLFKKNQQHIVFSKISNTTVNFEQLLAMINEDFGLPVASSNKLDLLRELNDFLIAKYAEGKQTILIIDEAQNLTPEILEELRLLSNLETDNAKLLHIIISGQPELRQMLNLPKLKQLRQRISCFCHVMPLDKDEIEPYILHRMERAGNRNAVSFSPASVELIWYYSHGIPRLINIICDFLLLLAFADGVNVITPELVKSVVADLNFEASYWGGDDVQAADRAEKQSLPDVLDRNSVTPGKNDLKDIPAEVPGRDAAPLKKDQVQVPQKFPPGKAPSNSKTPVPANAKEKKGFFRFLFRAS